jgi:L,D-transpeptidase ErfK/SrfK
MDEKCVCNISNSNLARVITLCALLPLSGCTELNIRGTPEAKPAPALPVLAAPLASHRFRFDPEIDDVVGEVQVIHALPGDTLPDIARRFNLGYEEIRRANPGVDTWLPGAGTEVVLPTQFVLPNVPRRGIVINLAAMRLYQFSRTDDGLVEVMTHPVGIGRVGWKTPAGTTKVTKKIAGPSWHPPASIRAEHRELGENLPAVVPPGPNNPLGTHALRLGWPSYLIHGTDKPYGVGMRSSHGCIRMYPEDIVEIFDSSPVGTPITVVNSPYLIGRHRDDLLVQSYGALEDDQRQWQTALRDLLDQHLSAPVRKKLRAQADAVNWDHIRSIVDTARGIPISATAEGTNSTTVLRVAKRVRNELPQGASWDGREELDPPQTASAH